MSIALVTNTHATGGASGGTTPAVDTTGASLLVVVIGYDDGGTPAVSDSKGNTWTPLTAHDSGSVASRMYYAANPTVGSGHTFTVSGVATISSLCMAAFSGVLTVLPFDVQNGSVTASSTTFLTGSITPAGANELVVAGIGHGASGVVAIDSGMTITDQVAFSTGNHWGSALAYLVQGAAAAINAKWTVMSTTAAGAEIAAFKPSGGGGGATVCPWFLFFDP